jgi:hypothetical protein
MRLRKALPVILLVLLLGPPCLHADDASRRAKVEELFTLIHLDETYGQMMTQIKAQSSQMTSQIFPTGAMTDTQKTQVAEFQGNVDTILQQSLSWESLKPEYIKLYTDEYTEPELDGMLTFYKSPVGQSMLAKTPELLKASSAIAMGRMATVEPKLRQMMEDLEQQVKQESGNGAKSQ